MVLKSLNSFIEIAKLKPKKYIAVAAAEDEHVLSAIKSAVIEGLVNPILIGNIAEVRSISKKIDFDLSSVELIEENDPKMACRVAVRIVRENKAQIVMKGMVGTADYLKAILNKEEGLRKGDLLSHIGFFDPPAYHKVIALTDAAQNIAPTLDEKVGILKNSIDLFHHLGIQTPRIAMISAVETVNAKMQSSTDAALLTMMNKRKQINGCIIDGPLAFDNAVSKEAAEHKGIVSEVAGETDLIFAHNIEVANALYKSFTYFGGASVAAIILGASAPIVLTSRADSDKSKLMSIALAASY